MRRAILDRAALCARLHVENFPYLRPLTPYPPLPIFESEPCVRSSKENRRYMNTKQERLPNKIRIIPVKGVSQTINYLLEDRDELDWLVAVGKNKSGEIFFYDTGGDILDDLGTLEYLKQRIIRAHFGDDPE